MTPEPDEPIEPEVIPPEARREAAKPEEKSPERKRSFYHPLSGLVILGVDWLAFGLEWPTGMMDSPVVSLLAFAVTFWAVRRIQLGDGDDARRAMWKAVIGAIAAGVPFPVTGTIVGAAILALSGLSRLKLR